MLFSDDPEDRIFALWFGFDRRSAMALQKETVRNIGKRLQLSIGGQLIGVHPIERGISNGVLPFILSESITEENRRDNKKRGIRIKQLVLKKIE